jgi:hypothetical protein
MAAGNSSSAITGQARFQSARLDITIDNNTTTVNATAVADIDLIAGSSSSAETNQVFANIINNHASSNGSDSLRLRVSDLDASSDPRIFLQGFVEAGTPDQDAEATWTANGNMPSGNEVNVSLTPTATPPSLGIPEVPDNTPPSP